MWCVARVNCLVVLMHGSETRAPRKAEQNLLETTETRMLRWTMEIRARAGVAHTSEKSREARLRRLDHVEKKLEEGIVSSKRIYLLRYTLFGKL